MNKIFLIGNLTADPVKSNSGDMTICRFTVAVNRRYSGSDTERTVEFFRVSTFRKTAENCAAYLAKGKKVAVTGSLQTSEYTDKEGNRRTGLDVTADEVEFLTPKGDGDYSGGGGERPSRADRLEPVSDNELPF